jgi:dTDP-4-amino-4,6-dideoxygalactose transaminase
MLAVNNLTPVVAKHRAAFDAAWQRVADRARFVLGEECERFEQEFADFCDVSHAIGTANGTDALEIALRALGVSVADRVLTVANAGMYASTAIRACGAIPQFVDVDESTMNLSPEHLSAALEAAPHPRAIIVTHLYGRMAPVEALLDVAARAGVPVIEDCAQAHGARANGQHAGSLGVLGCFSFYPTKNLGALGDGGAIVTQDQHLAGKVRQLRQYGWGEKYRVNMTGGRNSRLDELQAALLRARLPHLDAENDQRRTIAAKYAAEIRNPHIVVQARGGPSDCIHLFVVTSTRRDALAAHLAAHGIGSDIHYPVPDHLQPAFAGSMQALGLPVTERLASEVLTLPCHPGMSDQDASSVIAACNSFGG